MLQLEEQRRSTRSDDAATALAAPVAPAPTPPPTWVDGLGSSHPPHRHTNGGSNNGNKNKQGHKGKGKGHGSSWPRGGYTNSGGPRPPQPWVASPVQFWPPPTWTAQWATPPCPYPAQQGWVPPYQPQPRGPQHQSQRFHSPNPAAGQAFFTSDGLEPTQLSHAFQAMTLHQPEDTNWYMDTGASSHLTSESGFTDWDNINEEH
ncbi:hypothetical protein vseg_020588 [Gypsophila vaccaria]